MKAALTATLGILLAVASMDGFSQTNSAEAKIAELDADHLSPATRKRLTRGYAEVRKDDVPFYCKREAPLGSRLTTRKCYTIEQLVDMERVRVLTQQRVERKQAQNPTAGN